MIIGKRWYGDIDDTHNNSYDWDEHTIRDKCIQGTLRELEAYRAAGYIMKPLPPAKPRSPRAMRNYTNNPNPQITVSGTTMTAVMYAVMEKYGVTKAQLFGHGRCIQLVMARREAYYYCYKFLGRSTTQIGRFFNRDHTSIIDHIHAMEGRNKRLVINAHLPPALAPIDQRPMEGVPWQEHTVSESPPVG